MEGRARFGSPTHTVESIAIGSTYDTSYDTNSLHRNECFHGDIAASIALMMPMEVWTNGNVRPYSTNDIYFSIGIAGNLST